jgi:hypothetical protein
MGAAEDRCGLLIIRAWIEVGAERELRARITKTTDVSRRDEVSKVVATHDDVMMTVDGWLATFVDGHVTER